jgi:Tfp pilus assembly protein PilV
MATAPPRFRPIRPRPPGAAGFAILEFLLVAGILAIGLLGLGRLQVATLRAEAGARTRLAAAGLATEALESALAEAARARRRSGPEAAADPSPGASRSVQCFDREGVATAQAAFFTLTVTRSAAAGSPRLATVQAAVAWAEGAPPLARSLTLTRLVAP